MEVTAMTQREPLVRTLFYWLAFFLVLVFWDDLVFGSIFWSMSQFSVITSVVVAFVFSWRLGYWLALRGLAPEPGTVAGWMLKKFMLERKHPEFRKRQQLLIGKITSVAMAVPLSLIVGGVVTTLWLRSREIVDDVQAKKVALWLCAIYAVLFAIVHAFGIGGGILVTRH